MQVDETLTADTDVIGGGVSLKNHVHTGVTSGSGDTGPPVLKGRVMGILQDINHFWSGDLSVSSTGDLLLVNGLPRSQQRILRRLNTNPTSYISHPKYGAGLPEFIGETVDASEIGAVIKGQMLLEDSVAQSPAPAAKVTQPGQDAIAVAVQYTDQPSNAPTVLAYTLGG